MTPTSGIPDYIRDGLRPDPTPAAPSVGDQITASLGDAPWWAWPLTLLAGVAVLAAVGWLVARAARRGLAAIRAAAAGGVEQREQVAAFIRAQALTILFGVIVAIVVGLSAQTMVGWLRSIGMATHWAVLGFVAFDGMATMLALTLWQRTRRGESTGMIRPTLWALVGSAAWLNSHHAPEGNTAAAFAYAAFPVIAAVGLEFLLQEQRRDRDWLKEQAGEKSRRRLALVRWLHPIERVQVMLEMARDEDMGADEATRIVRERNIEQRRARAIRRVRTAVWTLRRDQAAPREWFGWVVDRRERVSEARAQTAIAAAQMATSTATVAVVLRELQMMTLAGRFAAMDYSSAAEARRAVGHLITEEALRPLELGAAPASPEGSDDFPPDGWGQAPELDDDFDYSEIPAQPLTSAQPERPVSGGTERSGEKPRAHLREVDFERLLSAQPADDETPVEPPAAHRRERPVSSSTAERRSLVAQLLEENPDMTGPEIADAVGARLGQPVSVATAKRDRAAVQKEQG